MQSPIVVVLAAGKGTRMKSETAKVLFPVAGKALIAWAVDTARQAGAETIVTVLGHQRDKVAAYLAERYPEAPPKIAVQEPPKGTGHAIQVALPTLASLSGDRMVVIVSGDAPLLPAARISELVAAAEASPAKMALLSTRAPRPMPYGRVVRGEHGRAVRIVEAKDASASELGIEELNAGFYAVALEHLRTDLLVPRRSS